MKNYNIPAKKWLYLSIAAAVILIGAIVVAVAGFGKSPQTSDTWKLTARLTNNFDFDEVSKDEIYSYVLSYFSADSKLQEGGYADYYEYFTVTSYSPMEISADDFHESVNEKFEGLLYDDWTSIHHLKPSFGEGNVYAILLISAILIILTFVIISLSANVRYAAIVVLGMIINALLSLSLIAILRIPVTYTVEVVVGTAVVFGAVQSVFMLSSLNSAVSKSKRKDLASVINEEINPAVKNACFYSSVISIITAVFVICGLFFRADSSWYFYSVTIFIALLTPKYFSTFILPGFYTAA